MKRICLGVHIHAGGAEGLAATLAGLHANTTHPLEIVLLADGPDPATQRALAGYAEYAQWATAVPRGGPFYFNHLLHHAPADLYIFLENGAVVGHGWLDYLLAALAAHPTHGLAGPSTNRAWNEQGIFPRGGGSLAEVMHTAETAATRFGASWQRLAPLYSLGDFCYAVKKEVVAAIGGADEAYGLGPCWEMDYNIRAARAGFQGVWACGAYVYRAPAAAQRRRQEHQWFTPNKQRYQDRFCGRRLRGEQTGYKSHCRGDACAHFAPPKLIQVQIPLAKKAADQDSKEESDKGQDEKGPPVANPQSPIASSSLLSPAQPLITCMMPTRDRPDFALQAVDYFLRQDYPERELIIVDDSLEDWQARLPDDPRLRFVRVPPGKSIGEKRNLACKMARGDIIAHWDDDDWYAPGRLSAQAAPLLSGAADICGLTGSVFFELDRWRFWTCTRPLHQRLFVENVHGGTLVYRRRVWQRLAQYPHRSLAEDAMFLRLAVQRGARLHRLPNDGLFLYLRHGENSWRFPCGRYLDPAGWREMAEPALPPTDRAFYAAQSAQASPPGLVSCIMPTADRRPFVPQAIAQFLQQDYPARELIVVDDGADAVADLMPNDERVRYFRLETRQTVGAKRNFACEQARGEIIAHWDDDDWMAPWRLSYQLRELQGAGADVCGLATVYYLTAERDRAWQYVYPANGRAWVAGNTLCYAKAFWRQNPFPAVNVGEDTRFVWSKTPKRIIQLADPTFMVALIHGGNVSPKRPQGERWRQVPVADVLAVMDSWAGPPLFSGLAERPGTHGAGGQRHRPTAADFLP
ncbi:MAG: glycosyltransferase [Ardenticatenaceae bacterium]|nr:glycosyltransferase [Ardenticatenaceae bacterium]